MDAQTDCLTKNANLVTFADQNELNFIKNLAFRMLQGSSSVNIWVKYHDKKILHKIKV